MISTIHLLTSYVNLAMFADIFKDDEPGDTSTELFLYKLIIQQAPTDICLLVPPHLEKWGYKIFFRVLYPHLKISGGALARPAF